MTRVVKPSSSDRATRAYESPVRERAAERTRTAVLQAAKEAFENGGWSGATVPAIAREAKVSPKTVEALYGTKSRLLEEVVTFAIRGDSAPIEMLKRPHIARMEQEPSAAGMLALHAAHLRRVNERSSEIAFVVEQGARADSGVAEIWQRMLANRRVGIGWAIRTLLAKRDAPERTARSLEPVFLVAFDWGTYRLLTTQGRLSPPQFQRWVEQYYRRMILG